MTTTRDVNAALQPLLARNSDVALVGRLLLVKPAHHLLRGILIDRTSNIAQFDPQWAIVFLFEPNARFSFNWGDRLYRDRGFWRADDSTTATELCDAIEQKVLPILRPIDSLEEFLRYLESPRFTKLEDHPWRAAIFHAARGDFAASRRVCAMLELRTDIAAIMPDEYNRVMKNLRPLVEANDRPALARLLHNWEAASVKALKLEAHWEPSPFPFEAID